MWNAMQPFMPISHGWPVSYPATCTPLENKKAIPKSFSIFNQIYLSSFFLKRCSSKNSLTVIAIKQVFSPLLYQNCFNYYEFFFFAFNIFFLRLFFVALKINNRSSSSVRTYSPQSKSQRPNAPSFGVYAPAERAETFLAVSSLPLHPLSLWSPFMY